jgi:hypothetical protein
MDMSTVHAVVPRVLAVTCALAVSVTLPGTVWAAERAATPPPSIRASVDRIAIAESQRLAKPAPPRRAARTIGAQSTDPNLESGSFFRRPVGIAVLAAFGIGLGYALYSSKEDRIRSSGR